MSALATLAEALARIEYKLDLLLGKQGPVYWPPMKHTQATCPCCRQLVEYQVDLVDQIVKRTCGCSTGKLPPLISFVIPAQPQGATDGRDPRRDPGPAEPPEPEDRSRGQVR